MCLARFAYPKGAAGATEPQAAEDGAAASLRRWATRTVSGPDPAKCAGRRYAPALLQRWDEPFRGRTPMVKRHWKRHYCGGWSGTVGAARQLQLYPGCCQPPDNPIRLRGRWRSRLRPCFCIWRVGPTIALRTLLAPVPYPSCPAEQLHSRTPRLNAIPPGRAAITLRYFLSSADGPNFSDHSALAVRLTGLGLPFIFSSNASGRNGPLVSASGFFSIQWQQGVQQQLDLEAPLINGLNLK